MKRYVLAIGLLINISVQRSSAIVFTDNFNAENGGHGGVGYAGFANWTTLPGYANLLGNSQSPNGLYVQLVSHGSGDPGFIFTDIHLGPGDYVFEISIGGNQVDRSAFSLTGSLGNDYVLISGFGADPQDPFRNELLPFTVSTEGDYRFVLSTTLSSPFIDNIVIRDSLDSPAVPDGGTTFGMLSGALALLALCRKLPR